MQTEKKDLSETRFHFYEDIGKPIGNTAINLKDFTSKLREIPLNCIEFHHKRGDFAKWIQNSLQDKTLAAAIRKIEAFGEELRTQLIEIITQQENTKICPKCKASLLPKKTWSMTGKIVGGGIRPKLTLGYYKCPYCGKGFRKVLAKELIKVNLTH